MAPWRVLVYDKWRSFYPTKPLASLVPLRGPRQAPPDKHTQKVRNRSSEARADAESPAEPLGRNSAYTVPLFFRSEGGFFFTFFAVPAFLCGYAFRRLLIIFQIIFNIILDFYVFRAF